MTQSVILWALLGLTLAPPTYAQESGEYQVYTEHPRLLLNTRRTRLLKRERERQSMRWTQFDTLMVGKARMVEPGFANALYGLVADSASSCRTAGDWAAATAKATDAGDLRQMALVFDWCQGKLSDTATSTLLRKLTAAARQPATEPIAIRSRLMAALAIADEDPKLAESVSREVVESWWKKTFAPRLKKDVQAFGTREQLYAMVEILHLVRDNFKTDLREESLQYFEELPPFLLLTYYPQPWPAAENEYRIPVFHNDGDPDLDQATFARAAELALVSYDGNPQPVQFLQGWLTQDRFQMKGPMGAVYEFFWANPYLPGLSYSYMPDLFHERGNLLVRANWDEDATWFGVLNGRIQYFYGGRRMVVNPKVSTKPLTVGEVKIEFWRDQMKLEAGILPVRERDSEDQKKSTEELVFIVGAKPNAAYDVEPDDEEMFEVRADTGGIIALKFARGRKIGVRLKEAILVRGN